VNIFDVFVGKKSSKYVDSFLAIFITATAEVSAAFADAW
jgi:hypothetical protein